MFLRENNENEEMLMNLPDLHAHYIGTALHCDVLDIIQGYLHNCNKTFKVVDEKNLLKLKADWKTKCVKIVGSKEGFGEKQYHILYNKSLHKPVAVAILDKYWTSVDNNISILHEGLFDKLLTEDILKVGVVKYESSSENLKELIFELGE